jgi:hypothetical protein
VKVGVNRLGGYRNAMSFVLCGLDIEAKAALVQAQLEDTVGPAGLTWQLARTDRPDADTQAAACATLTAHIRDTDAHRTGRAFSQAAVELALASYPGCTLTSAPGDASPFGVFQAEFLAQADVPHTAVLPDGTRIPVPPPATTAEPEILEEKGRYSDHFSPRSPTPGTAGTVRAALGTVVGARSGDKGGDANVGVWARSDAAYEWLRAYLTVAELQRLLPECAPLSVDRYDLPNLRALNFVVHGLLGEGVAASTRFDPQAKALGEWLRSRVVDLPASLA